MSGPTLTQRIKDLEENPTLMSFYVKRNCKKCNGKGYININISTINGWEDTTVVCDCVFKNLKKEMSSNG